VPTIPGHDIIVIGASAGGVEALTRLVSRLPADLPAAVFVVIHFPSSGVSVLPNILSRAGQLPAEHVVDGEPIRHGRIYVAPPDYHMLVKPGYVRRVRGPRENGHRPAVDPLFRTAARSYGRRVVGVVLSGALDDGTAGLSVVVDQGGVAVVQDPADALHPGMPSSAIANVAVHHVLPLHGIAPLLTELAAQPVGADTPHSDAPQPDPVEMEMSSERPEEMTGQPAPFTCPECGGAVWEKSEGDVIRFRCHVGHAFSGESMLEKQSEALEALLRALKESGAMARRMAIRSSERGHELVAQRYQQQAQDADRRAALIHEVLLRGEATAGGNGGDPTPKSASAAGD
jgi:two-component system chemotaxis response regulator CheB